MEEKVIQKPRLPGYFYVRLDKETSVDGEVLVFSSERRRIRLAGRGLSDFYRRVIPLLDGTRTVEEIHRMVGGTFSREDLDRSLQLLNRHRLLEDGAGGGPAPEQDSRLAPQLNYFREYGMGDDAQNCLAGSTVAIAGAGGAAAAAILSLAACGVGRLRVFDTHQVTPADCYLATNFDPEDCGTSRVAALERKIARLFPGTKFEPLTDPISSDDDMTRLIDGADFVIGCVDAGLSSHLYRLNRVCHARGIPWSSASVSGFEGILGPTIFPRRTACYLCYKMRTVACAENPEDEFDFQKFLDQRKRDDSGQRENLVFCAGVMGNLLGLEAFRCLMGLREPLSLGNIMVVDFTTMSMTRHLVLKKPWCPVCYL